MDILNQLKGYRLLSLGIIVTGFMLLLYMIFIENKPGAVPLKRIVLGIGLYLITPNRTRSHH